ncbi:phospholipase B1, membrane-associated-like [Schistocerca americana]|uniref:phospholipase B1, membrane-associated-like n=1 Tax=Schistocerca americana TaxID=7009 RepID=UPI001F4FF279|nr:phospholipase B1, membrane-associated-like [Schistocerca americana]
MAVRADWRCLAASVLILTSAASPVAASSEAATPARSPASAPAGEATPRPGGQPTPLASAAQWATARLSWLADAAQDAADAVLELPRQLLLLPIRLGYYPGLKREQDEIPELVRFPCWREVAAARNSSGGDVPGSVHRLRPQDIAVIAALGDSITAANGAMAYTEDETRLNYRGVSAMGGGRGTWRRYLTLANILREFNPRLRGFALRPAETGTLLAGLNLAENGALDDSLIHQARRLVLMLRRDPFVDVGKHWKLVNILIGGNDLCNEYCHVDDGKDSADGHRQQLEAALLYLKRHLPRTLVNIIHIPNLLQLRDMQNVPVVCHVKQLVLCSCLFGGAERVKATSVAALLQGYWDAERQLALDDRFENEEFAVVLQPFFLGVESPADVNTWFGAAPDLSYFAPDCFHFSQKAHALIANALWNNVLEPVGNKTEGWRPLMQRFLCPSAEAPYFFTRNNSNKFFDTGRQ